MANEKIEIEVVLDDGSIKKGFAVINSEAKKVGADVEGNLNKSFSAIGLAFKGAIAAAAGVAASAFAFDKVVKSGIEAEKAVTLFSASLRNAGNFSSEAVKSFTNYASALERTTGVSDELILQNAALLTSIGKLSGDALQGATKAALDLGVGLQIGPEAAFSLVAKAAAGSTSALGRYGIKVDESIPKSERFAFVLAQINERFGGLSEAQANTFAGALARLQIGFGNIVEELGKIIIRSPKAIAAINTLASVVQDFADKITKLGTGKDPFGDFISSALRFGQTITSYVVKPIEFLANISGTALRALALGFQVIAASVANIGNQIVQRIVAPLASIGSSLGSGLVSLFDKELGSKMADSSKAFITDVQNFSTQLAQTTAEQTTEFANQTRESMAGAFDFNISDSVTKLITDLQVAADTATPLVEQLGNNIKGAAAGINKSMVDIGQAFRSSLAGALSNGMQLITKALMSGQASFANFAKIFLGILGDMAIQIGSTLIFAGIGIESLKTLGGGAAIAAGLALVAIGTVLKSFAGGGEGTSTGVGSSPGGGGIAASPDTQIQQQQDVERDQKQTQVQVVVQGNILDRRETGLAISEIISESFDLQGTKIVTGVV